MYIPLHIRLPSRIYSLLAVVAAARTVTSPLKGFGSQVCVCVCIFFFFFFLIKKNLYLYACIWARAHLSVGNLGSQMTCSNPLERELRLTWVLATELGSSARAVHTQLPLLTPRHLCGPCCSWSESSFSLGFLLRACSSPKLFLRGPSFCTH